MRCWIGLAFVCASLFLSPALAQVQARSLSHGIVTDDEWRVTENGAELVLRVLEARPRADIEAAAERGDGEALYILGVAHWQGLGGVAVDTVRARALLRRAVLGGFSRATLAYGRLVFAGFGGEANPEEAVSWWEAGADAGQTGAMVALADYYRLREPTPDYDRARQYFDRAVELGDVSAIAGLGDMLYWGEGVAANPAAAFEAYQRAANAGALRGVHRVASMLRDGGAVQRDQARARALLIEAGSRHYYPAAEMAAHMMIHGEGGAVDLPGAAALLSPLIEGLTWSGKDILAKLVINRVASPVQGYDFERMAVDADIHGYPSAIEALIVNYREGRHGHPRDLRRAAELARSALERGEARPLTANGAWPMHLKGYAHVIQMALAEGVAAARDGEAERLAAHYGPYQGRMLRFTTTLQCRGSEVDFTFYAWNSSDGRSPAVWQFDWVEASSGCSAPRDVRESHQRLMERAVASGRLYTDLIGEAARGNAAPVVPVIDF